jgi:hypothetical protein
MYTHAGLGSMAVQAQRCLHAFCLHTSDGNAACLRLELMQGLGPAVAAVLFYVNGNEWSIMVSDL